MKHCAILIAAIAMLCIPAAPSSADIYQYTDENGVVHFSNVSAGNSTKYRRIKQGSKHAPSAKKASRPAPRRTPSSTGSNAPNAYSGIIRDVCMHHGVDPELVHAVVRVESGFNPNAVSRKGAMGLMQLMPQTAVDLNVRNTFNPRENIDGGVKYLRRLLDRYEGNLTLALAAYNSGETAVNKWGTVPPYPETRNYVRKILRLYNGTGLPNTARSTIYVRYDDDGALLITDDPSRHTSRFLKHATQQEL